MPWQGWEGKRRKVLVQPSVPPSMYLWVSRALLCSNRISSSSLLPCMLEGATFSGCPPSLLDFLQLVPCENSLDHRLFPADRDGEKVGLCVSMCSTFIFSPDPLVTSPVGVAILLSRWAGGGGRATDLPACIHAALGGCSQGHSARSACHSPESSTLAQWAPWASPVISDS